MDTNGVSWTSDDVKLVEKFIEIKSRGYYVDGRQLTEAYNHILHKNANVTQCGSCLRQRVNELEAALNRFKRLSEQEKQEEPTVTPQEENKEPEEKKTGKKKTK